MMDCHRNNEIYYFENKRNFLDVLALLLSASHYFSIREFENSKNDMAQSITPKITV